MAQQPAGNECEIVAKCPWVEPGCQLPLTKQKAEERERQRQNECRVERKLPNKPSN